MTIRFRSDMSPRCVGLRVNSQSPCDQPIAQSANLDHYICTRCGRIYTDGDLVWVRRMNAYDDMEKARKEQAKKSAKNPKAEGLA